MTLSAGTHLGPYKILSPLGAGGMGEVYRARDPRMGRDVAIKICAERFGDRFEREVHAVAALNHPNICHIYDVGPNYLVMELVEGPTLAARFRGGALPLEEALTIARQIADALEAAHEKGIIHCDLKPGNIKITSDGAVKVLDFGLAKVAQASACDPEASPTLTMQGTVAGQILGTAAYMSPEQTRGRTVDKRADIWAFGVVLYEMLCGRRLFGGQTLSDTLAGVLETPPDWSLLPAETPESIRRLLRRCLQRDRKQRLPDIAMARLEIDEAPAGRPELPVSPIPAHPHFRWWNAGIALLALAGLAVAIVHFRETRLQPVPVRFQIPAPSSASFGYGIALSPEGRKLAFIGREGAEGHTMMWVRPLDSLSARPLAGTEGAFFFPFWSPDGSSIGFWAEGKLKRVEASGGSPRTLCDVPATAFGGATWSRDGIIVIGSNSDGLFRVPQAGGVPTRLTTVDSSHGELGHTLPWFLPDGRHFLFIVRSAKPADNGIHLGTVDGIQRKQLIASAQTCAFAAPPSGSENGHLLFLRGGTLMAQALDTRRFELIGEPFPVAEQVGPRGGLAVSTGLYSVSASGVLAYRSAAATSSQLVWFDRAGKPLESLPFFAINNLELSPDGKRVALEATDDTGSRDIWILDLVRGVPSRLTFDPAQALRPAWSPDGRRLVFASGRGGNSLYDMYEKNSSGSADEQLLAKSGMPDDWSADGRYIVYELRDPKTRADLWVLPVAEASADRKPMPYLRTASDERQGPFSPDGRWLAYISNESVPNQYQVYVQSFPAGAGKFQVSTGAGGLQPRWRRDGKELFYIATDGKLMAVKVKTAPEFEAGAPQPLFDPRIVAGAHPAWARYDVTADGKRFLVNSTLATKEGTTSEPITVVLNWQAAIKR